MLLAYGSWLLTRKRPLTILAVVLFLYSHPIFSQSTWEYGGFLEESGLIYARKPNQADAYAEAIGKFRAWGRAPIGTRVSIRGAFELQVDTHRNVDRSRWLDLENRGLRQPAGSVSELYLDVKLGRVDLRAGKQRIRWGRADGFNPTDNIAPYDYLQTFNDERPAVTALRADAYLARADLELVWLPYYTPTRLPLLGQRWFPRLPSTAAIPQLPGTGTVADLAYRDLGGPLPARTFGNGQWGVRYNQILSRGEFSFSYFDGFDDLPYFRSDLAPVPDPQPGPPKILVSLSREYHRVRVAGLDFASEIGPVGIRGEAAYFDQTDPLNQDHLLYVVGVDKRWGEWFVIMQYAGQKVNGRVADTLVFPDLGLGSTLIWRVERTIGPARSFELKGALRLAAGDLLLQPLYSVALSNSWRIKLGGTIIAGRHSTYLGQFRDNSNLNLRLLYSW